MLSRKKLLLFFLIVAAVYGMLLIPWPGVMPAYRRFVATIGNIVFDRIGNARLSFKPMDVPTVNQDIEVEFRNLKVTQTKPMTVNARRRVYLPTAFAMSFILAAPVVWRRKLVSAGLGFVLITAYGCFSIWLILVSALSDPRLGVLSMSPFEQNAIRKLMAVLAMSPVTPYIAALLVFVLVTVRRDDLVRLAAGWRKPKEPATKT